MSHLYLLVDSAGNGFKIGVSIDVSQRIAALPENIDRAKSFQIKCGEKNSYRVEKILHRLFQKYHLEKEVGAGYTEWFSMECFEAVQDFIHSQRDLLGWTCFEPIPKPPTILPPRVIPSLSQEEKQQILVERDQNCNQKFQVALKVFEYGINKLLEMQLEIFELQSGFILIQTGNHDRYETANDVLSDFMQLSYDMDGHHSKFILHYGGVWHTKEAIGIINAFHPGELFEMDDQYLKILEMIPASSTIRTPMRLNCGFFPDIFYIPNLSSRAGTHKRNR